MTLIGYPVMCEPRGLKQLVRDAIGAAPA